MHQGYSQGTNELINKIDMSWISHPVNNDPQEYPKPYSEDRVFTYNSALEGWSAGQMHASNCMGGEFFFDEFASSEQDFKNLANAQQSTWPIYQRTPVKNILEAAETKAVGTHLCSRTDRQESCSIHQLVSEGVQTPQNISPADQDQ